MRRAIEIGALDSRVAKLKAEPRAYGVLSDLNTRPRTSYLASVRNPNPAMPPVAGGAPAGLRCRTNQSRMT